MSTDYLNRVLDPTSLVLIGASEREGSPGRALANNLLNSGYTGRVQLVNPRYPEVLGAPCLKSVKDIEGDIDVALVLVPTPLLRRTLVSCARRGIHTAIIYSGADDPKDLHRYARRLGMRLFGPWCAGLMRPHLSLNATFASNQVQTGSLAVVSQSATLAAALIDWAEASKVGFSALLSTGSDVDVRLSDLLDLLAEDYRTRAIIVYLDHVRGSRALLSALAAAARSKPVVLMKSTHDGASHCDALTRSGREFSSDDAFQAALSRTGVVRIRTFSNLFSAARILSTRIRTRGRRIAIITNGAAPAMLARERLEQRGFICSVLQEATQDALASELDTPKLALGPLRLSSRSTTHWTGNNPIVLRDPQQLATMLQTTLGVLEAAKEFDAIVVMFVPDARNDPNDIAQAVIRAKPSKPPTIACWMGEAQVRKARDALTDAGIPSFATPEAATDAVDFLHRYFRSQQQLLQLPAPTASDTRIDVERARTLVRVALDNGERILGPQRTRLLMRNLDIDVLPAARATNADEAISAAQGIGYPVVVKLVSPNIAWKSPIIRTALNVHGDDGVRDAFNAARDALQRERPDAEFRGVLVERQHAPADARDISIKLHRDPSFGPVISVSIGGDLSSLMQSRIVQLPPLNGFLIDDMLSEAPLSDYLGAFRHHDAVDPAPLAAVLRRVSEIACEVPDVFSLDINPLIVSSGRAVAVDVHVVLERSRRLPGSHKRYGHLSIHPWPRQWTRQITLKDQRSLILRAIRPEDGRGLQAMVRDMSEESRYFRFMHAINALTPAMLAQFTKLDYDRQIAFVADPGTGSLCGVSRYAIDRDGRAAEFAISIADDRHGQGLATVLMELLIEHARSRDLHSIYGDVLNSNTGMRHLMKKLGFTAHQSQIDDDLLVYTLQLTTAEPT